MKEIETLMAEFKAEDEYIEEIQLRAKRYWRERKWPQNPEAWLRKAEVQIPNDITRLPPNLREEFEMLFRTQLRHAKHCLANGDADGLTVAIMLLDTNCETVRTNIRLHREASYSALQSDKGDKGAQARWGNRGELNKKIKELAQRQDDWGSLPTAELWPLLYAWLDENRLNPSETTGKTTDKSRIIWDGNPSGISYKTFKNQISAHRQQQNKK
ncbi:hypothetical protein [Microbulbifer halophilus]|uniref:Uncharacterized protein n=1 Tax=Microbulbifer halophilus TaxID=453963 RepID=A0ABW5EB68_9GAMM|nr:hypothetical protein [Microbulbifer halophilus]MCW8125772.1 hypothetical protein [Microbulbifer halophilus]